MGTFHLTQHVVLVFVYSVCVYAFLYTLHALNKAQFGHANFSGSGLGASESMSVCVSEEKP